MDYKTLGHTDIKVSTICLGTMTYGEQNTEAEGHSQLDYALERGINFIDTAELYAIPPKAETYGKTEANEVETTISIAPVAGSRPAVAAAADPRAAAQHTVVAQLRPLRINYRIYRIVSTPFPNITVRLP